MSNVRTKRIIVAAAAVALGQLSLAANITWNGSASSFWADGNWTNGGATSYQPANGDALFFDSNNASGPSLSNNIGAMTASGINFNSIAAGFTIAGNGINISPTQQTFAGAMSGGNITDNAAANQTLSLPVTLAPGNHTISTGSGAGQLNLNGVFTRSTGASVQFTKSGGNISLASSGLANDSSGILGGWAIIGLGTNLGNWASLDGSGNVVAYSGYTGFNGGTSFGGLNDATKNVKIQTRSSSVNTLNGTTGGTYSMNTLLWNIGNSNPGGDQTMQVASGQTLRLGVNGAIMNVHAGSRTLNIGSTSGNTGVITAGGTDNTAGDLNLYAVPFTNNSQRLQIRTGIVDNGSGAVTVNSFGYIEMHSANNANSYTGGARIMDGRLQADATSSFGTGPVTVFPGGQAFPWNSGNAGNFSNNFTISGFGTDNGQDPGAIRFQSGTTFSGTFTLAGDASVGGTTTLNGPITGPGGLTVGTTAGFVSGNLTFNMSTPNDYAGDTRIDAATSNSTNSIIIGGTSNIMPHGGGKGNLILLGGSPQAATFDLNGTTQTINALSSGGTAANAIVTSANGGGQLIIGDSNATGAFAGRITGGGNTSVTKIGSGVQTLAGSSSYTGTTTIQNGVLSITGSLDQGSAVNLDNGNASPTLAGAGDGVASGIVGAVSLPSNNGSNIAHLSPGATGSGSIGKLTISTLSISGGDLTLDLSSNATAGTTYDFISVGSLSLPNSSSAWSITPSGGAAAGTYSVMTAANSNIGADAALPSVNAPSGDPHLRPATFVPSFSGNSLLVTVGGGAASITWTGSAGGGGNGAWDINNTHNWNDSGAGAPTGKFYNGDSVAFDDSGANRNITIVAGPLGETSVVPGAINVNSSLDYTIGGNPITGVAKLTKSGNGALALSGSNSYTGGTTLNAGALNIGNASAVGSGTFTINGGTIDNTSGADMTLATNVAQTWGGDFTFVGSHSLHLANGPVAINGAGVNVNVATNTLTVGGAISGTGSLTKSGAGTLMLGAINSYPAGTSVNGGTLVLSSGGATGAIRGTLNINSGAAVRASAVNAFGYAGDGTKIDTVNINGGFLDSTILDDQGWNVAYSLNGGSMQTNGGVSSAASNGKFAFGGLGGGQNTSVTTLANDNPSSIAGHIDLRGDNGNNNVNFTVADGNASIDLIVSAAITRHSTTEFVGITKDGAGAMQLTGANTISGPITVQAGTLIASNTAGAGNGSNGPLGVASLGSRTVTVNAGATLVLDINNVFGGNGVAVANLPSVIVNGGTVNATHYNAMGNVTLNGATLVQSSIDSGNYEGYQFRKTITVGGSRPSTISSPIGKANHLGAATTFDVADATGDASVDLTVSVPLRDQSGDFALAAGSLVKTGPGTMALTAANTYTGGTSVQNGLLVTSSNFSNGSLSVTGGTAQVAQKMTSDAPAGVTVVPAMNFSEGTLDLTNNAAVINYSGSSPIDSIRSALAGGFNGGAWNGQGINSSTAASVNGMADPHPRALGFGEASELGISSFYGQTVGNSSLLIAYTLSGDASLDGIVNGLDFNAVASNFGATGVVWTQGDFNYDGQVNTDDFNALAQNFNQLVPSPAPAAALGELVPEPGAIVLALAGLPIMSRRRRSGREEA